MPSQPQPLTQIFASVVLDGSGNGVANIGPTRTREHWQVVAAGVSVTAANPAVGPLSDAICSVFVGSNLSSATFLSATFTGSSGDTCDCGNIDIQPGMQVWAQWKGGDPGQTATVTVFGTYTRGQP